MPQPSCCFSINFLNRMLDGLTKFRCVRICLLRPLPLPVRGKAIRWGWLSLLTVCRVGAQEVAALFFVRARSPSTPRISSRSPQRAAHDAPPRVRVRCVRFRALPLDPHRWPGLEMCALWLAGVAPSAAGGCFCIFGIEPWDHGIQPWDIGHGNLTVGTEDRSTLCPRRVPPSNCTASTGL